MFGLLVSLLAVTLGYILWSRRHLYQLTWKFGGRLGYPLIGSFFDYLDVTDFGQYLRETIWRKNQSPYAVWLGSTLHMIIKDPHYTQMVLTSNDLLDKHILFETFYPATGKNTLVAAKPKLWKVQRRIIDPFLNKKNVDKSIPSINKAIDTLINKSLRPLRNKAEVNIYNLLADLIMELTLENITGQNIKWLEKQSGLPVAEILFKIQHNVEDRANKVYLHNDFLYKLSKNGREVYALTEKLEQVFQDLVINNYSTDSCVYTTGENTLINTLRKHTGEEGFTNYDNQYQLASFAMASFETTTFTLTLTIYYLAMYPEIQQKLFEELLSFYPEKNPNVEADTINELTYMDMLLNEVMRLHPPAPLIGRSAAKDTTLANGTFIPKGVQFLIDICSLQRNEKYWGPDANEFNPENFLPENRERRHPLAFIPFAAGPRNCIGIRSAKHAMKISLAKLFRTFKITTSCKMADVKLKRGFIMQILNPPLIAIEERSS